jgi:hypothetical protein
MIRFDKILIPFSSVQYLREHGAGYTGVVVYYIFGMRISEIQLTSPWH